MMGKNFRDTLEEQLRDPEFRAEIEALKPKRETGLKAETIKDLFAKFYGEYMREEIDWGKPVGEEIYDSAAVMLCLRVCLWKRKRIF